MAIMKIAVCISVALLALYAFWMRSEVATYRAKADRLETAMERNNKALVELQAEINRRDAVIAERDAALAEADKTTSTLLSQLEEVKRNDKATANWADSPIPAAVGMLIKAGDGNGSAENNPAARVDARSAKSAIQREDKRGLAPLGIDATGATCQGECQPGSATEVGK